MPAGHDISAPDLAATVSGLTAVSSVAGTDEVGVNVADVAKKATATQIKAFVNGLTFLGRTQLGAAAADITVSFTGQAGLFLLIGRITGYSGAGGIARWRFNGDAGSNYQYSASEPADAASTSPVTAQNGILVGETAQTTERSPQVAWVTKGSTGEVALLHGSGGDGTLSLTTAFGLINYGGWWNNTAALISSVTLNGGGVNLNTGSWVEVYGVRNS